MHEPRTEATHSSSPRAESLAAQLAALTGGTPRITAGEGRTRIEIDLPEHLTEPARHMLLAVLADADSRGHDADGGYVWAEIQDPALPDPRTLNLDQQRGIACALCGARLYTTRRLGTVEHRYGHRDQWVEAIELWACSPAC